MIRYIQILRQGQTQKYACLNRPNAMYSTTPPPKANPNTNGRFISSTISDTVLSRMPRIIAILEYTMAQKFESDIVSLIDMVANNLHLTEVLRHDSPILIKRINNLGAEHELTQPKAVCFKSNNLFCRIDIEFGLSQILSRYLLRCSIFSCSERSS